MKDPRYKLSEGELATLERNDKKILPAYGIFTNDMLAKRLEGGPKKDVEEKRAQIQLKISRGETISEADRTFLDELNKADPIIQLRRDILGGKDTAPPTKTVKPKLSKEAALRKLLDAPENKGFTADSQEVKDALKRYGY